MTDSPAARLFMPPFYGWLLDTRGGYLPMLISIVLCSVGCLVRGLATNVTELYVAAMDANSVGPGGPPGPLGRTIA